MIERVDSMKEMNDKPIFDKDRAKEGAIKVLLEKYPESEHHNRIKNGITNACKLWKNSDGSTKEFIDFCIQNFTIDQDLLERSSERLSNAYESIYGYALSTLRDVQFPIHIDIGPIIPVDHLIADYDPFSTISENAFDSKIGYFALLNYEVSKLRQRIEIGKTWTRRKWADERFAELFIDRIPPNINQQSSQALNLTGNYIASYNIYLHNIITSDDGRLFNNPDLKLISHWGLRDELKTNYKEKDNGFKKQKLIAKVMEAIIQQTIPKRVINKPDIEWNIDSKVELKSKEKDNRYNLLLEIFNAQKKLAEHSTIYDNYIDLTFESYIQILEENVISLLEGLLYSKTFKKIADLISDRLNRELEPFDIWYSGFKQNRSHTESELDNITRKRYPTAMAFQKDFPRIFKHLGFSDEKIKLLTDSIVVDPSRGAGHAYSFIKRDDKAHLRTRLNSNGMNYKGYNIAIHELGHNVEQVFSTKLMDFITLRGVPNTAFTEAIAFIFQGKDIELLGLNIESKLSNDYKILDNFWNTCELATVSLTEIKIWHYLYDNPESTPEDLKNATLKISEEIWNKTYRPFVREKQVSHLPAIYSHYLSYPLYMSNYAIGKLIAFQLESFLQKGNLASEIERVCRIGNLTPNQWMNEAVGEDISFKPLLSASENAIDNVI